MRPVTVTMTFETMIEEGMKGTLKVQGDLHRDPINITVRDSLGHYYEIPINRVTHLTITPRGGNHAEQSHYLPDRGRERGSPRSEAGSQFQPEVHGDRLQAGDRPAGRLGEGDAGADYDRPPRSDLEPRPQAPPAPKVGPQLVHVHVLLDFDTYLSGGDYRPVLYHRLGRACNILSRTPEGDYLHLDVRHPYVTLLSIEEKQ